MSSCPRCNQLVNPQAVRCPHCGNILKAYGHSGIPLHQAAKDTFLCDRCVYHEDNTCTFPQRPHAKTCTLYQDKTIIDFQPISPPFKVKFKIWLRRNRGLLLLLGLIIISIIVVLVR